MLDPQPPSLRERFFGCILGQAVGDALAAPFEGMPADAIYYGFGSARKIISKPPVDTLCYTDDTQMMIGVAECLLEHGSVDERALMAAFVRNFQPDRGYGPGVHRILQAASAGEEWTALVRTIYPGGSLGNGAAMRVAPVGLAFHRELDRVAEEAERSALVTHVHPLGVDSARVLALAVAILVRNQRFDRDEFYSELIGRARTEEFHYQLSTASRFGPDDSVAVLGNGIEAHRSVVTSIACFALHAESFTDAVGRALGLGGDVDTLAAMTGALSGTHLGLRAISRKLVEMLENDQKGSDYLHTLAGRLHERFVESACK